MNKIQDLKNFLQKNYPNIQAFNTKNIAGDSMECVYNKNGIVVDYCYYWNYIEIFGLTEKQFENLLDENSSLGTNLKTFEIKE